MQVVVPAAAARVSAVGLAFLKRPWLPCRSLIGVRRFSLQHETAPYRRGLLGCSRLAHTRAPDPPASTAVETARGEHVVQQAALLTQWDELSKTEICQRKDEVIKARRRAGGPRGLHEALLNRGGVTHVGGSCRRCRRCRRVCRRCRFRVFFARGPSPLPLRVVSRWRRCEMRVFCPHFMALIESFYLFIQSCSDGVDEGGSIQGCSCEPGLPNTTLS